MSELENYLRKFNIRPDVRKKQGGRAPFFRRGGHRSTGLKRRTTQYLGQYYQCIEWHATVGIAALASQLPPFISVYYRHNWFSINASMVRINLTWYSLAFSHLQSLRSTKTENWGHRSKNWTWGILGTNNLTSAVDRLFIKSLPTVEKRPIDEWMSTPTFSMASSPRNRSGRVVATKQRSARVQDSFAEE